MNPKEQFKQELIELCLKHRMIAVPTYENEPSVHDPMTIVELDEFWEDFLNSRLTI